MAVEERLRANYSPNLDLHVISFRSSLGIHSHMPIWLAVHPSTYLEESLWAAKTNL